MEVTQIYGFKDVQLFNVFMQKNHREFAVREIRIVPVVVNDTVLIIHYLVAEVKWMMCDEIWQRYTQVIGSPEAM